LFTTSNIFQPLFSIVIATYGRDKHIIPTLKSVAHQDLRDFEVIVVSDGAHSGELNDIVTHFGSNFSLHSLPIRTRSQSGPNNFGWSISRGKYIAYLGHDDIWSPNHLSLLAEAYTSSAGSDFAVSGCIYFGPSGTGDDLTWVTGLFGNKDLEAAQKNFFPPSSLSHRRNLPDNIPRWSDPELTRRPVDTEFIVGAFERNCSFVSTGEISVFKFASALRYLSYLQPDDYEQLRVLEMMNDSPKFEQFVRDRVQASIQNGGYMEVGHAPIDLFTPGQKVNENDIVRGIKVPKAIELTGKEMVDVGDDFRGLDWYAPEEVAGKRVRWSGPNSRPRMLLPFFYKGLVAFDIRIISFESPLVQKSLRIFLNGTEVKFRLMRSGTAFRISFKSTLKESGVSFVEFQMTELEELIDGKSRRGKRGLFPLQKGSRSDLVFRKRGLCLEEMCLRPLESSGL